MIQHVLPEMSHDMRKGTLESCGLRAFKCTCAATPNGQRYDSLFEASSSIILCIHVNPRSLK